MCYKPDDKFIYSCVDVYKGMNNGKIFYYFIENNEIIAGAGVISSVSGGNTTNKKYAQSGKDITLKCSHPTNGVVSIIINESENKIIFNGYRVNTPIIWGSKIFFMSPDPYVKNQHSHHKEVELDRVSGMLYALMWPNDRVLVPKFQCEKTKALF